jgi:fructose-bisphosphate aldolase, class I
MDKRLAKLFPDGKGLFLAYDQGLEHGPTDFSGENADPAYILKLAGTGHFDGFICHRGIAEQYAVDRKVPLILKLNGKTSLTEGEPVSKAVTTVEDAVKLGADAVGYTVYVGSAHEAEMLTEFGKILDEAHAAGLPVFGWMYPRGGKVKDPKDPDTIAYAARVGLELGADAVKIYYPGSPEKLAEIVKLAGKSKVVVAGGLRTDPDSFSKQVQQIMAAGAAGVAVGRNVWQADDPEAIAAKIRQEVHGG